MAEQIVVLDEQQMLSKIMDLPNQLEKAWTSLWIKDIAVKTEQIENIVIAGMGGSGISGALAAELCRGSKTPITIWSDYGLPGFVSEKTLLMAVSYSGDTEETIDAVKTALELKCQVIGITHGGKLKELGQIHGFPTIDVDYESAPRAAIGWLYGSVVTLLAKLKVVEISESQFFESLKELQEAVKAKIFPSKAENVAMSLNNKVPMILTQSPLSAVAKRWVNQLNENSKTFAFTANVPELCHNTIVGLDYPVPEKLVVLYLESKFAFSRNIARRHVVEKIIEKNDIVFIPFSVRSKSLLSEQLLLIHFGDLLSYYVAGVYGVDPTPVESIQILKEELKKV